MGRDVVHAYGINVSRALDVINRTIFESSTCPDDAPEWEASIIFPYDSDMAVIGVEMEASEEDGIVVTDAVRSAAAKALSLIPDEVMDRIKEELARNNAYWGSDDPTREKLTETGMPRPRFHVLPCGT